MPSSCESRARKRWASLITGLPRERARVLACCKASAALTVKRSGLIIVVHGWSPPPRATSVPGKDAVLAEDAKDVARRRSLTPPCYASVIRLCATSFVLRLLSLFDDDFPRDSFAVNDELVDVDPGHRLLPGIAYVPIPVRAVRTAHGGGAAERKAIERLARAPENRDRHELGEHVVDPQGYHRPVTLEEQLPADPERDRGRRVKQIRAILLWPDRGRRGLAQCPPRSPFPP